MLGDQCTEMADLLTYFSLVIVCFAAGTLAATTPAPSCESLKSPINGLVQCSMNDTTLSCTAFCITGFVFETTERTISRDCTSGVWSGSQALPKCVANHCMNTLLKGVNDTQITASSVFSGAKSLYFGTDRARLESDVVMVNNVVLSGGWRAADNSLSEFIQVELNEVMEIRGIITKGRAVLAGDSAKEYVTQYRLLYSDDGRTWQSYRSLTVSDQFLAGNVDNTSPKVNLLDCPFNAKFVRINPLFWHENIALRFDLIGCKSNSSNTTCLGTQTTTQQTTTTVRTTRPEVHVTTQPQAQTTTQAQVQITTQGQVQTTTDVQTPTHPVVATTTRGVTAAPTTAAPTNLCRAIPPPTNGMINCEEQSTQLVCVGNCRDSYIFETKDLLVKKVCDQSTGVWRGGSGLPACIYNTAATPLPPKSNDTHGCLTAKNDCDIVGNGDFHACGGCHFFASCSEGYLYVRACPEHLVFDAISGVCDYHSRSCPDINFVG